MLAPVHVPVHMPALAPVYVHARNPVHVHAPMPVRVCAHAPVRMRMCLRFSLSMHVPATLCLIRCVHVPVHCVPVRARARVCVIIVTNTIGVIFLLLYCHR